MILGISKKAVVIGAVVVGIGLIYLMGSNGNDASGGVGGVGGASGGGSGCRVTVTADVLNVRAAPDPNSQVVDQYSRDRETDAETQVQNGFRKLADNRWASDEFLQPVQGTNCG